MDELEGRFAKVDDDTRTGMTLHTVVTLIVSVLAVVLILFGLWAIGGAVYAAWGLFREPAGIAYFAQYFLETTRLATLVPSGGEGLAHYLSWVMVILLLLVLGKLGAWAITSGAQLLDPAIRRRK